MYLYLYSLNLAVLRLVVQICKSILLLLQMPLLKLQMMRMRMRMTTDILSGYGPGTVWHEARALFHQILTTTLGDWYCHHPPCTDGEAEA